mgnify:CR=1 FL=1
MILIIDNYDSFTWNLVQAIETLGDRVNVKANDKLTLINVSELNPDKIIISPGPGTPKDAGFSNQIIKNLWTNIPMLGVCLGHQCIGEVFGAKLINLDKVYHGVKTSIKILKRDILFKNLPDNLVVGRYHSWIINKAIPDCLEITSVDDSGQIMSIRHKNYNIRGVQFHPESILTPFGKKILKNWINN